MTSLFVARSTHACFDSVLANLRRLRRRNCLRFNFVVILLTLCAGLSVHGAAQKLKGEIKRLSAFALATNEDDLEMGIGEQGPEVRAKSTGKSINYWGLANIVNVNSAILPADMYEITLNCRYIWRAPFKVPDT